MKISLLFAMFTGLAIGWATPPSGAATLDIAPTVLPDSPQNYRLKLNGLSQLLTESRCDLREGSDGQSDWRGFVREGEMGVQMIDVRFGVCHLLFARPLGDVRTPYVLVGDIAQPLGEPLVIVYSDYGNSIREQMLHIMAVLQMRGFPTGESLAGLETLP